MGLPVADIALSVWAAGVSAIHVHAAARAGSWRAPAREPGDAHATDVLLVRPCAGADPSLRELLRSTGDMVEARGVAVVFAVGSESDPAHPIAVDVADGLRRRGIDVSVRVTTTRGPNHKAAQLETVCRDAGRPFVVVADSDVDLAGLRLGALVAELRWDERTAAVWAPPVESPVDPTLGDRLSAAVLGASLHAFPVLVGLDPRGMVGKLFAVRRASVDACGGFGALRNVLGEDVELARRLRERGERVAVAPTIGRARPRGRRVVDVVRRFARWMMVLRGQRPGLLVTYPSLFCATTPLVLACLVAGGGVAWIAAAAVAISRWLVACAGARRAGSPLPSIPLLVASDLVLLAALVLALRTRSVRWRDRSLRLGARGELTEVLVGSS